jgi:hypothetical protein
MSVTTSMPVTVSAFQTPVLTPNQVAPIVITPVTTGARPKTPTVPPPPPLSNPDHVTRSITGNSQPRQGFVRSVGKSFVNSVKSKQKKDQKTRSISK